MPAEWSLRRAYHTPKKGPIAWLPMPTGMKNGSRGLVDGRGDHAVPRYADADSGFVVETVKRPCIGTIEKGGQMQVQNGRKCDQVPIAAKRPPIHIQSVVDELLWVPEFE